MHKYYVLLKQTWQTGIAYPLSFGLWRIRQLLATLMSLTVWSVIYTQNQQVFGYDRSEMITYILFVSVLQGAILSTDLHSLAGDIYSGAISQLLLKPLNIFAYLATREIADKGKNLLFLLFESSVLFVIFKPTLPTPSFETFLLLLFWLLAGIGIHFFIEILFGTLGFWSPQSWGPKFLFFMMVDATAGKLFPLDILPTTAQQLFFLTPFPYLSYVQTQLFLGRLDTQHIFHFSIGICLWLGILALAAYKIWQRGIRDYSAAGQ